MEKPTDGQFRRLVLDAPDVVAILEADMTVRYVCSSVRRVLGRPPEEVAGRNLREYLHPQDAESVLRSRARPPGNGREDGPRTFEVRMRHKDGSWRFFDAVAVDRLNDPGFGGIAVYLRDVTERKAREEQLAHQALHDPLTGLPNRTLFMDRLSHALDASSRSGDQVAVLFLDLDGFKDVNDSLGHAAGDRVLIAFGQRVRASVRPGDTVARLGGDEFAVLIEEAAHDAQWVARRIEEALKEPMTLEGGRVHLSTSVGVATGGPGTARASDLMRAADAAMYRAKARSRSRRGSAAGSDIEAGGENERDAGHLALEERLRGAVERGELGLCYLAAAPPDTRRISCMEALLRWEDSMLGALLPQEIIDVAGRSDLLALMGRWILKEACRQASVWREMWPANPPLISVNLSASQVRQASLPGTIAAVLRETGLSPEALMLEVAEEALTVEAVGEVVEKLDALKALGVKVAIDDFAPGNSELPDFQRLPIDYLKFGRSLVRGLGPGRKNARLLMSLYTNLAQARGIRVVAEGVESIEQLEELKRMECDLVQGFYLWRPLPAQEATDLLGANLGRP